MKLRKVSVSVVLIMAGSLAVSHLLSKQGAKQAQAHVRFLELANDVAGATVAIFSLSNAGPCGVELAGHRVEVRHLPHLDGAGSAYVPRLLPSGRAVAVVLLAPRTQDQWRVTFHYYPLDLRSRVERLAERLGLRVPSRVVVVLTASSDWMPATLRPTWMESGSNSLPIVDH